MINLALPKTSKAFTLSMLISCFCFSLANGQAGSKIIVAGGAKAELFGPGIISTGNEWAPSFTPDGKTVYFTRGPGVIYFSKLVNGKLTKARVAAFSGKWRDMDPFVSPDGTRLFFSSYRPVNGDPNGDAPKFAHIWYVNAITDDNWSVPHHLEAPVNLEGISNYAPSVSSLGTLCFSSSKRDSVAGRKSYYTKWLGTHFDEPKLLSLNGSSNTGDPFISPDESYILFKSNNDIYISYRRDNKWADGQKLGTEVNKGEPNSGPYISPDGKMLYYSSDSAKGILMIPIQIDQPNK